MLSMNLGKVMTATNRPRQAQRQLAIPLLYVVALAAALLLVADGRLVWLALIVAASVAVAGAYRFPLLTIAALAALWALPLMFGDTTSGQAIATASVNHVPIGDLPLLPMAGAVGIRAVWLASRKSHVRLSKTWHAIVFLAAVLALIVLVAIARGFSVYPLSALREFTVDYLGLIVVPYVVLFVRTPQNMVRLLKATAVFSVGVPFVLLPLIGHLKGWGIGADSRFYPSPVDMGLLYAVTAAYVLGRSNQRWRRFFGLIVVPVIAFIIADSNRSVWLAGIVVCLVLLATKRIRLARFWKWGLVTALLVAAGLSALTVLGANPVGYVIVRGRALTNPSADPTASWRIAVWQSAIEQSQSHLVFGRGFGVAKGVGAYYNFGVVAGQDVTAFPHNMYVMTLYNLGLAAVLLYLALAGALIAALLAVWRRERTSGVTELEPVVLMGMIAAFGTLTYGVAYAFEEYSMLYVGLGLAAALLLQHRYNDDVSSVGGTTVS